jgi:hypothetical protein
MDKSSSSEMLVSLFNYGGNLENVYITYDGGDEWISIEGDLPDLPVHWAMFDPASHDRAIIATEAGVWTTDDINGDLTHWEPSNPNNGMPFVPVYMLVMRDSDKAVLAATHGRGLITTDVFSAPAAVIIAQPIAYEDQPIVIDGSFSVNAQTYEWKLNNVTVSTAKTFSHTFDNPGTYAFTLEINGEIETTRTISVLPYLPAPYQESEFGYTGDFESSPEHFAAYTVSGTGFSRGSSTKPGKEGTHSGANAWILGKDVSFYENNTRAELYTPQYDLSQSGLFELKFWSKFAIQNKNDGFQIEYSLNSGATWQQLGSADDPAWYNYLNSNLDDGAWPKGKAYFTNIQLGWTQYVKDISFLAGEDKVSFRFVFRSDDTQQGQSIGIVIDDFELTKYQGPLQTTITVFAAQYDEEQEITFNWTTGIEYHAKQFMLERSFTGFGFEHVATLNATGGVSTVPQEYTRVDQNLRDLTYYRLKSINDNPELGYHYEFYSDTIIVRRDVEPDLVHKVLTNPFTDRIRISFRSMVNSSVTMRMFDTSGKLVMERVDTPNSVAYELNNLRFTPGIYILSIQVGENEPSTHKMCTY